MANKKRRHWKRVWLVDNLGVCYYCGMDADTEDHVIPYSVLDTLPQGVAKEWLVPACRECNGFLGDSYVFHLEERRELVHQKIAQRYSRYLDSKVWQDEELDEFGHNLESFLRGANAVREMTLLRLSYGRVTDQEPTDWIEAQGAAERAIGLTSPDPEDPDLTV